MIFTIETADVDFCENRVFLPRLISSDGCSCQSPSESIIQRSAIAPCASVPESMPSILAGAWLMAFMAIFISSIFSCTSLSVSGSRVSSAEIHGAVLAKGACLASGSGGGG